MSAAIFLKSIFDFWIFMTNLNSAYIFLLVGGSAPPMEVLIIEIVVYLCLSLFVTFSILVIYGIYKLLTIPALGPDPKSELENGLTKRPCLALREARNGTLEVIREVATPASVRSPHHTITMRPPRGPDVGLVFIPKFEKEVLI